MPSARLSLGLSVVGVEAVPFEKRTSSLDSHIDVLGISGDISLSAALDSRVPSSSTAVPCDANYTARAFRLRPLVLAVLSRRNHSEVAPSIIEPVAVNMVNLIWRPVPRLHRPDNPMCSAREFIHAAMTITMVSLGGKSRLPGVSGSPSQGHRLVVVPEKIARFRIVTQPLTKVFRCGNWLLSHAMLQSSLWSGVDRRSNDFQPRHYPLKSQCIQGGMVVPHALK